MAVDPKESAKERHPHLTQSKLLEILKTFESTDQVEMLKCNIRPGCGKGENYSSDLVACDLEANVKGQGKEYHLMAKLASSDPHKAPLMRCLKVEEKEVTMYRDVIPAWKKLCQKRNAAFELNCFPALHTEFHEDTVKGSMLVMQDLAHLGYRDAVNKKKGLSLSHAKVVLEEIAKFHALGYAYLKSYPDGIAQGLKENESIVTDYMYVRPHEFSQSVFKSFDQGLYLSTCNLLELVQEEGQDLCGIFEKHRANCDVTKLRQKIYGPNPSGFNTLCHGDIWFNNVMFYYENGEPTKASLIDLAITRYASPAVDLNYFLYSSTTPMLRATHLEDLLGFYHDNFMRCLHNLGEDPTVYTYRQLVKDFDRYAYVGLDVTITALPALLAKEEDAMTQEDFKGDWTDQDTVNKVMDKMRDMSLKALTNEPQIKIVIGGNFIDLFKKGVFELIGFT